MTSPDYIPPPAVGWWVETNVAEFVPAGVETWTGFAPATPAGLLTIPPPGTETWTGGVPTLFIGSAANYATPPTGTETWTGGVPGQDRANQVPAGVERWSGFAPIAGADYFDDFNRANDTGALGSNWTNQKNHMGIEGNAAYPVNSQENFATYNKVMITNNFKITVVLGSITNPNNSTIHLVGGANASGECATLHCNGGLGGMWSIMSKFTWNNVVTRANDTIGWATGDTVTFQRIGNVYTAFRNGGAPVLTWTDSTDVVPRDSSHRLAGLGGQPFGANYRTIDSWRAQDAQVPDSLQPSGPAGSWSLVFNDQFDSGLDLDKWSSTWFGGNGYQSNTHSSAANVTVSGGELALTLANSTSGASINTNPFDNIGNLTKDGFTFGEGAVVEARIKFPGDGAHLYNQPRFWVGDYPYTCEHDIAAVNASGQLHVDYFHGGGESDQGAVAGYWGGAYHTYTFQRFGDGHAPGVAVYIDGVQKETYLTNDNNTQMYIGINLGRQDTETYPAYGTASKVLVDYVRAWIPA